PGRDGESLRIDNCVCFRRFEITDAGDSIATYRDVRLFRLGTGAVINGAVFDDDVIIQRPRRWGLILRKRCAHNRQEPTEPKEPSLHYVGGSYRAAISAQKGMQAVAAFDVAKFTKRRGERPRIRKSPRNMNNVSNAFARSALECGASSHRFVPCRRLRPR